MAGDHIKRMSAGVENGAKREPDRAKPQEMTLKDKQFGD
jgi:hypothetical protein